MKTIVLLTPVRETRLFRQIVHRQIEILTSHISPSFSMECLFLPCGPTQITSRNDEAAALKVLQEILHSFEYDNNVLINCTADVGLECIRTRVKRVVGIGDAGFSKALGNEEKMSIIVPTEDYVEGVRSQIQRLNFDTSVTGIFDLGLDVRSYLFDAEAAAERTDSLIRANSLADSGSILFGCGTMLLFYEELSSETYFKTIVEPTVAGVKCLESQIKGGTSANSTDD